MPPEPDTQAFATKPKNKRDKAICLKFIEKLSHMPRAFRQEKYNDIQKTGEAYN